MHTILVIDDENDYRAGLREVLELEQYQTLEAENGLMGWQMIQQYSPDLVICDIAMPVMNGIEVLKTLKSTPSFADLPFIIISGEDDKILASAFRLGANVVLRKPVDITVLMYALDPYLKNEPSTMSDQ